MTIYSKPAVRSSWGQTATGSDLVDPGNTYASAGWQIGVKPPRQYFNWVLNYVFAGIRYFSQNGIPAWDAAETYGSYGYVISPNGYMCRANGPSTNLNPDTNFGPTKAWDSPNVLTPPSPDNTSRVPNTAWVTSGFLPVGSAFTAISGQIQSSQVPVGAVTQWQGSLSIAGAQISSPVQRTQTLLLSGTSNYASFNWVGQSGQPAWLFGSNDGINAYVWNPSNFRVANANTVGDLTVNSAAAGNTVVARDGNGYIYGQYLNQASSNNENPAISQFMVTNGGDGFLRKASIAAVQAALGTLTAANFAFSSAGWQKILTGGIIQAGRSLINGTTNVTFPLAFPHGCFGVAFTNENSTNQIYLNAAPSATFFQAANGNAVVDWVAFGW